MSIEVELMLPEKKIFSGKADMILLPGITGNFAVLPNHAPLIAILDIGIINISTGKNEKKWIIEGGFAEVKKNQVFILAECAINPHELVQIDEQKKLEDILENSKKTSAKKEKQLKLQRLKVALAS